MRFVVHVYGIARLGLVFSLYGLWYGKGSGAGGGFH